MAEKEVEFSPNTIIYTYDISDLESSKKVRFVYALKGRGDEEGIVQQLGGFFLAPGCFALPIKHKKEIEEIFRLWKVKNKKHSVLMR